MAIQYFDYTKMMTEIDFYVSKYRFISVSGICQSMLGKMIPAIMLGEGKTVVTFIGGQEGCDGISPYILIRFVRDICALYEEGGAAFGFSAESILKNYTIVVIPMLNPDGVDYSFCGIKEDNPLKERVIKLNSGSDDFSSWRGNARGIELKYNYGLQNEENEPEPETGALCNFLKYGLKPDLLFVFSQSEDNEDCLYYGEGEAENKMAIALSQMSGMKRIYRESRKPKLMLADWSMQELKNYAFSFELSKMICSSYKKIEDKSFSYYVKIRKIFFCAPFLNKIINN